MTPEEMKDEYLQTEQKAQTALRGLMQICWHHTEDPAGEHLSKRDYARIVGRSDTLIKRYVKGYKLLLAGNPRVPSSDDMTPTEAYLRAGMSDEKEAATDAVKNEANVTFTTAAKTMAPQVRQAQVLAKEMAQQRGSEPRAELPAAAQAVVAAATSPSAVPAAPIIPLPSVASSSTPAQDGPPTTITPEMQERARQREEDRKRNQRWAGWMEFGGDIVAARNSLRTAIRKSEKVNCTAEDGIMIGPDLFIEIEQLVSQLRSILHITPERGRGLRVIR